MVSLKLRERTALLTEIKQQTSKAATMLDDSDYQAIINKGIAILDEHLYNPREIIIDQTYLTTQKGGVFADVTSLNIDEINNVYYSPNDGDQLLADATLGVGLMPYLSSTWGVSIIQNLTGYLVLQGNLNKLNRQVADCDDYQLWPVNSEGKQLLQIRKNPNLFWLEYLPHLSPTEDDWYLFEHEKTFLIDYCRSEVFIRNAEFVFAASVLGFGKEAKEQLDYWTNKQEKLIKAFQDGRIITYIG